MTQDIPTVPADAASATPQVPPRPQAQSADPIVDTLKGLARPQPQQGATAEHARSQPKYQATPLLPPHLLQQPLPDMAFQQSAVYDGAVGSLLSAVLNQRRDVNTKFHMLLVPDSAVPAVHTFDTIEELKAAVKEQLGTSTYIFCFLGHSLRITKGPFHFLQTPYGAVPLHDIPAPTEQETVTDGWVGQEPPITEFVRQPEQVDEQSDADAAALSDDDDDENFDDDNVDDAAIQDETQLF